MATPPLLLLNDKTTGTGRLDGAVRPSPLGQPGRAVLQILKHHPQLTTMLTHSDLSSLLVSSSFVHFALESW